MMEDLEAAANAVPSTRSRAPLRQASRMTPPRLNSVVSNARSDASRERAGSGGDDLRKMLRQATGLKRRNSVAPVRLEKQKTMKSNRLFASHQQKHQEQESTVTQETLLDDWEDDDTSVAKVVAARKTAWQKRRFASARRSEESGAMNSLGEIPSVSFATEAWELARLLLIAAAIAAPGLVIGLLVAPANESECYVVEGVCLWAWATFAGAAVVALGLLRLAVKIVARICMLSRFIGSNHAFLLLRVHGRLAQVLWSVFLFLYWEYLIAPRINSSVGNETGTVIRKVLACFVAYACLWLLRDIIVLEIAHRYLWEPYFERVQDSLLSQFLLLIVNDYALQGRSEPEDQLFALQMTERAESGAAVSLFAIAKAVSFAPSKIRMYTDSEDAETTLDSAKAARRYGYQLFDALIANASLIMNLNSATTPAMKTQPMTTARTQRSPFADSIDDCWCPQASTSTSASNGNANAAASEEKSQQASAPEDCSASGRVKELREPVRTNSSGSQLNSGGNHVQRLSPVAEQRTVKMGAKTGSDGVVGNGGSGGGSGGGGGGMSTLFAPLLKGLGLQSAHAPDETANPNVTAAANALRSRNGSANSENQGPSFHLVMLRCVMCKKLAIKFFELIAPPQSKIMSLTRDQFTEGIVNLYRQRKSLALTLEDYETIVHKLGRVIAVFLGFVLFFVALWIWTSHPLELGVSLVSLAVAFSFVFGQSAADFCDACLFIFVTRAYDVGDRIFFVDDTNQEQNYTVARINMLGTVLKRWDEQMVWFPNKKLAQKEIRNMKRSGIGVHKVDLTVSSTTPNEKLDLLLHGLQTFAEFGGTGSALFTVIPETIAFTRISISGGNRLNVVLTFSQRSSFQNPSVRFHNLNAMMVELARLSTDLHIEYQNPLQPIGLIGAGNMFESGASGSGTDPQAQKGGAVRDHSASAPAAVAQHLPEVDATAPGFAK